MSLMIRKQMIRNRNAAFVWRKLGQFKQKAGAPSITPDTPLLVMAEAEYRMKSGWTAPGQVEATKDATAGMARNCERVIGDGEYPGVNR